MRENLQLAFQLMQSLYGKPGFLEAKNLFEALYKQLDKTIFTLTPDEILAGQKKGKINCIKLYRERTGYGLREAKDHVELYFANNGLKFPY